MGVIDCGCGRKLVDKLKCGNCGKEYDKSFENSVSYNYEIANPKPSWVKVTKIDENGYPIDCDCDSDVSEFD
jgi:hypothetical protein